MGQRFVGFFLIFCLYSAPVYAVTIVDVSEVLTVVEQKYLSDCEWIETVEIRTTTTYQESYYSYPEPPNDLMLPVTLDFTTPPVIKYSGFRNPCFPEAGDENTEIPDYCGAELRFPDIVGSGVGGVVSPIWLFRGWSELVTTYNFVHYNECDYCDLNPTPGGGDWGDSTTPTPEPANWILGLTGLAMVLISRRLSKGKSRSSSL